MRNVVIFLLLVFAAVQGDTASSAGVLTQEQAVTMALRQNRDMQSAALEVGKAEALRRATQSLRLPSLQVGVTGRRPIWEFEYQSSLFPPMMMQTRERAREPGAAAFFGKSPVRISFMRLTGP